MFAGSRNLWLLCFLALSVAAIEVSAAGAGAVETEGGIFNVDLPFVTCGSVVKLSHEQTGKYLHGSGVTWGTGSSQQSVTVTPKANDAGSLWLVKEDHRAVEACELGKPIPCGSAVRLEHLTSGRLLHSHLYKAPLSGFQETSAFGEGGRGDTGDDFIVSCEDAGMKVWMRGKVVTLTHRDTMLTLTSSDKFVFNMANCGQQCPIMDQNEVACAAQSPALKPSTLWRTGQGVYFDNPSKTDEDPRDVNEEL